MKKPIIAILAILILVLLGYVALHQTSKDDLEEARDGENSGLLAEQNAVFMNDQKPGNRLTVSMAVLDAPGFVAIHADSNGAPGPIIGASGLLVPGENRNAEIILSREALEGEIMHAMLHKDNGNGTFDPSTDEPVKSALGGSIQMRFEIDPDANPPEVEL